MQSIKIDVGLIKLAINDDESRIIEFNPNDISFLERFYSLISDFEAKETEYRERAAKLGENDEKDAYGLPKNVGQSIELVKEICTYLREKLDEVFGAGASQKAFGNANTLNMFDQFLDGVTPYIQNARTGKIDKYTGNRAQRRSGAKVMK